DVAPLGQLRRNFDEGVRNQLPNSRGAVGQDTFVKVLEQAAIIQMQIVLLIGLVLRKPHLDRKELCLPVREGETLSVKQRGVSPVRADRPVQGLVAFQTLVSYPGKKGAKGRDFFANLRRMLILPTGPEAIRNVLQNLPIGAGPFQRLKNFVEPLNASFG